MKEFYSSPKTTRILFTHQVGTSTYIVGYCDMIVFVQIGGHMKYYLWTIPSYSEKEVYWTGDFTKDNRPTTSVFLDKATGFNTHDEAMDLGMEHPPLHWLRIGPR